MNDRQIQVQSPDYVLARRQRPRGAWGQMWQALLEPGPFFRALPTTSGRGWLWAALLVLALVAFSAVRQSELSGTNAGTGAALNVPSDPLAFLNNPPAAGGGAPSGFGPAPTTEPVAPANPAAVSATWTTALVAASGIILSWIILSVMLCEVWLFNGTAPRLGRNMQVAIWASLPIGLMAGLQLLYYSAGGAVGQPGLSGLLPLWDGYAELSSFLRSLALSISMRLTIFDLWSLALIYIGARRALGGKWWAVALVIVGWTIVIVLVPVLTGAVAADPVDSTELPGAMPFDMGVPLDSLPPSIFEGLPPPEGGSPFGDAPPETLPETGPAGLTLEDLRATLTPEAAAITPEMAPDETPETGGS